MEREVNPEAEACDEPQETRGDLANTSPCAMAGEGIEAEGHNISECLY